MERVGLGWLHLHKYVIQCSVMQYNVLSEWLAEQLAPKERNAQFYTFQLNLWVTEFTSCGCACIQE